MDDIQLTEIQAAYNDSCVVLCRPLLALNDIGFRSQKHPYSIHIYIICYEVVLTCTRHALN
jgi:hypothetical protein